MFEMVLLAFLEPAALQRGLLRALATIRLSLGHNGSNWVIADASSWCRRFGWSVDLYPLAVCSSTTERRCPDSSRTPSNQSSHAQSAW
ncbi:hypothetical protein C8Q76DRAFT_747131 [Earliella scabrosa]|nr:hypothetical protein C8Q76DRAFT_747131 [Earliella scabrosa]